MIANQLDPRIVDVDGYVHVVNGKVICFSPDVYDLTKPGDVEALLQFSEALYVHEGLRAEYGKDSVCVLRPSGRPGSHGIFGQCHVDQLPEDLRHVVKEARKNYA